MMTTTQSPHNHHHHCGLTATNDYGDNVDDDT